MNMKTPLYEQHVAANAKIVDFSGWDMPIHYGSQLEEHKAVRENAGMFDVSHMTVVDVRGEQAFSYLQTLLANDVAKLKEHGKALYSCMLNEEGKVIDDLLVYFIKDNYYRLVVNASTRDKDLAWIERQAQPFNVEVREQKQCAIIAVQGPQALKKVNALLSPSQQQAVMDLKPFTSVTVDQWVIARTGYTGEDGYEIMLPFAKAIDFWQRCVKASIKPCGLGARDTLRLEAGLNLYGTDMDETTSPLESNLGWTIAWEPQSRDFIGKKALLQQKQKGLNKRLVGLVLQGRGVLRNHLKVVVEGEGEGEITSGSFSPTLGKGIALARIPTGNADRCKIEVRDKWLDAKIVKPPFVKKGKILVE